MIKLGTTSFIEHLLIAGRVSMSKCYKNHMIDKYSKAQFMENTLNKLNNLNNLKTSLCGQILNYKNHQKTAQHGTCHLLKTHVQECEF